MGLFKKKKKQTELAKRPYTASGNEAGKPRGLGRLRRDKPWIYRGILVSLCFAVIFSCFYDIFRSRAEKFEKNPIETADNIAWLYQNCYLLYRDLCNALSGELLDYGNVYLETDEEHQWILDKARREEYMDLLTAITLIQEIGRATCRERV